MGYEQLPWRNWCIGTCSFINTTSSFTGRDLRDQRWAVAFAETQDLCCSVPEPQQCRHSDTIQPQRPLANLYDEMRHRETKQTHQWQTSNRNIQLLAQED